MMIRIQVSLSFPYDGSFVAHSMSMKIQKTVPASAKATSVNNNSDPIICRSAWTKDYKPEGSRSMSMVRVRAVLDPLNRPVKYV